MSIAQYSNITRTEGIILDNSAPVQTTYIPKETQVILEINETDEVTFLSEEALTKIWMTPEEDEAWKNL